MFSPVAEPSGRAGGKVGSAREDNEGGLLTELMFLRVLVPTHLGGPR